MGYLGEVRLYAGPVPPPGWAFADGSPLSTLDYQKLAAVIGNTYGTGVELRLPDLRSRTFLHGDVSVFDSGLTLHGGQESVILTDMPAHEHRAGCNSSASDSSTVAGSILAAGQNIYIFSAIAGNSSLNSQSVSFVGTNQPHSNIQPYTSLNFIVCIAGGEVPVAGTPSGGTFTDLGGMIILAAFWSVTPAPYFRTDGQAVSRTTFAGLFAIFGTAFGNGDGITTFNLPDLRDRTINGAGGSYAIGDVNGESLHTLSGTEIPAHVHTPYGVSEAADSGNPFNSFLASSPSYTATVNGDTMGAAAVGRTTGGSVYTVSPHENRQPFSYLTAFIAADDVSPVLNTGDVIIGPWASAPTGMQLCNGISLAVSTDANLFAVIGYNYGGSGANFSVPNLSGGRIPVGAGASPGNSAYALGQTGGSETVTLTVDQLPMHSHSLDAMTGKITGQSTSPFNKILASGALGSIAYKASGTKVALNADAIRPEGGGLPHENRMPMVTLNYFIVL